MQACRSDGESVWVTEWVTEQRGVPDPLYPSYDPVPAEDDAASQRKPKVQPKGNVQQDHLSHLGWGTEVICDTSGVLLGRGNGA